MTIIEKEIVINLDGKEGSAWVLLEYAREYAKDFLGLVSENDIESICDEMKDGDYENLLLVFDKYFGEYVLLARTPVLWPDDFDVDKHLDLHIAFHRISGVHDIITDPQDYRRYIGSKLELDNVRRMD